VQALNLNEDVSTAAAAAATVVSVAGDEVAVDTAMPHVMESGNDRL